MSASIFDVFKGYKSDWKELAVRPFTQEEANQVVDGKAVVGPSNYGKSFCFTMVATQEKKYLPLEPSCCLETGTEVPLTSIAMVKLAYEGTDPERIGKNCIRGRLITSKSSGEVDNFDDPFGLKNKKEEDEDEWDDITYDDSHDDWRDSYRDAFEDDPEACWGREW